MRDTLARLEQTISQRSSAAPDSSYVASLFAKGRGKIAQKVGEEATETIIAALSGDADHLTAESRVGAVCVDGDGVLLGHKFPCRGTGSKQVALQMVQCRNCRPPGLWGRTRSHGKGCDVTSRHHCCL